jgi:hypothetical protein
MRNANKASISKLMNLRTSMMSTGTTTTRLSTPLKLKGAEDLMKSTGTLHTSILYNIM